jgi:trans-2,3-dihydro-3-hydroxyanthranilate isomerase
MTRTPAALEFATLDVFTATRFGGNPLAVVMDPQAVLDTTRMQAVAREFNLSETTFVRPGRSPDADAEVRIFTPAAELPWAGHPNVGTAWLIAQRAALREPRRYRFDERAGPVTVDVDAGPLGPVAAWVHAPQPLLVSATAPADVLAACIGLPPQDVVGGTGGPPGSAPAAVSVGVPFPVVEAVSRDALARACGDPALMAAALAPLGLGGVVVWCRETRAADHVDGAPVDLAARMFAPLLGVAEDPATGSAMAALAAWLAAREVAAGGRDAGPREHRLRIAQGVDGGPPSLLLTRVTTEADCVTAVAVGGACVPVTEGRITVHGH